MHRVPPSNRPPSNRPPPPAANARAPRKPKHVEEKARINKKGISEEETVGEVAGAEPRDVHEQEETAHQHAEVMGWTTESHGEAVDRKEEAEERLEEAQRDQQDEKEQDAQDPRQQATRPERLTQKQQPLGTPSKKDEFLKAQAEARAQAGTPQPKIKHSDVGSQRLGAQTVSAAKTTDAVREAAERQARSGKPPDAFTLLNQAQPHGVFFKEDYEREGHSEEQEDPELRAAVEECIRLMFGVRGIVRVGSGRNQADEPVVVIVVGQGFGETSMRAVPEKVHRFSTLLALPFDVLPLKKER
ncbi:MAG: hypothetical protein IPJ65_43020 [Archangiaceae bacterium]|nr:hypothetical protein [Archangiaceae bacterium]